MDGILYVNKGGVSWRMLPKDLLHWKTVYDYYPQWNRSGLWSEISDHLNERYRLAKGRAATPTYAILDTQSVQTQYHGEERGFDGGKKYTVGKGTSALIYLACCCMSSAMQRISQTQNKPVQ